MVSFWSRLTDPYRSPLVALIPVIFVGEIVAALLFGEATFARFCLDLLLLLAMWVVGWKVATAAFETVSRFQIATTGRFQAAYAAADYSLKRVTITPYWLVCCGPFAAVPALLSCVRTLRAATRLAEAEVFADEWVDLMEKNPADARLAPGTERLHAAVMFDDRDESVAGGKGDAVVTTAGLPSRDRL